MRGVLRKLTSCPNCTLAAFGVAFASSIVILFLGDLQGRYRDAIARANQSVRNQAEVLAADAARAFDNVDRSLRVAEIAHRTAAESAAGGGATARSAHDVLNQIKRASPMIVSIGWTNAAGDLLAASHEGNPPARNVAARPYFIAQRDNPDAGLFVAPPFRSARTGRWLTAASRRLTDPDGSFAGVVNATLDPAYFAGIYRSINVGSGGTVMLFHRDGLLLAREPFVAEAIGRSFADSRLFAEYLNSTDAGTYEISGYYDGRPRISGYKAVPDLPLVVLVSVSRAEILAPWYHYLYTFGPMVAFVVVVILIGTLLLMRQTQKIADKSNELEQTLDNVAHGLVMVDRDLRLIVCNRRYAEMYGLGPELTKPGTPLRAILEARVVAGISPADAEDFVAQRLHEASSREPFHIVNRMSDGRVIAIGHQPIPGKGAVGVHQDVTAEKRIEASLIAKSDELGRANMRFDAALNNMTQGLCMFDAAHRLVVANNRFGEIYGLTAEQTKPGTTAQQILEYRIANGTYDELPAGEYLKKVFREASDLQTLPNGRVVSILRQWLPDGSVLTTHEDITDRRQNEAKVAFMAHHDLLTGLANRTFFLEKIEEAGARLRRRGEAFAVFMLDLDRFKDVNDSLGHPAGDALLKEMAQRLRSSLRETDVLARLGGDEFAILQEGERDQRDAATMLAARVIEVIAKPFDLDGRKVSVGTSIGIALAPQDGIDADELLKKADLALYRTKSAGRNGFNFFDASMTAEADARHQLESEIREAIARSEFELFYQPVVDVATREVCAAEALVRWRHPTKGLVAPDRFISLAEDTGLIVQIGAWILQKACSDAAAWPTPIKLAVNLSPMQFRKGDVFDLILCALVDSGLPPERLEVEITESVLLENETSYRVLLQQLKNIGVSIVLDDFGTGYSSLGYLTTFPVDKIKIDKTFTHGLLRRADCAAIVASVLTLARGLDIETTAEGVETEEQFEMLRAAGVTMAQGYLFGRPRPAAELEFTLPAPRERAADAA